MNLELTFRDFASLAANGKVEKNGVTITFARPVLSEVTVDPGKGGKATFFLDEADDRAKAASTD